MAEVRSSRHRAALNVGFRDHLIGSVGTLLGRERSLDRAVGLYTPVQLAGLWKAAEGLREPVWRDMARLLSRIAEVFPEGAGMNRTRG
jgi:hypothetical protein